MRSSASKSPSPTGEADTVTEELKTQSKADEQKEQERRKREYFEFKAWMRRHRCHWSGIACNGSVSSIEVDPRALVRMCSYHCEMWRRWDQETFEHQFRSTLTDVAAGYWGAFRGAGPVPVAF